MILLLFFLQKCKLSCSGKFTALHCLFCFENSRIFPETAKKYVFKIPNNLSTQKLIWRALKLMFICLALFFETGSKQTIVQVERISIPNSTTRRTKMSWKYGHEKYDLFPPIFRVTYLCWVGSLACCCFSSQEMKYDFVHVYYFQSRSPIIIVHRENIQHRTDVEIVNFHSVSSSQTDKSSNQIFMHS